MRNLLLLGYSGSIGRQALDLLKEDNKYRLIGIGASTSVKDIDDIKRDFPSLQSVALAGRDEYINPNIPHIYCGKDALLALIEAYPRAVIINSIVGLAGLRITIRALETDHQILLANKESLVIGGDLIEQLLKDHPKSSIFPIDSEHSALEKLTHHEEEVKKLIITCSGGALRDYPLEKLENVTPEEVLSHPTWQMGSRITIDCATLINKAFEVIEAHYLFNISMDKIEVLMHDESLIHSLICLKDNSLLAELGPSDMRIPLSYALYKKRETKKCFKPLEITDLHFRKMDFVRYPLFRKVINWYNDNHASMAVVNAADEVAVEAFLSKKIKFTDIRIVIEKTMDRVRLFNIESLEDILYLSECATDEAQQIIVELDKGE